MAEIKLKIASVVIGSGEGGGGGVAPYYADLPDKPSINGETLSGEMTSEDLGLASESQAVPAGGTTGQVLAKKSNADNDVQWVNQQSGEQGTMDYADLDNKPQINSVTLSGNKTLSQLGIQGELTFDNTPTANSNNPVKSGGVKTALDAKQDTLVSGTSIKTVNNTSLLGSGNIQIDDGVGFQTITTQQDGTMVITLTNGDTITIDLNHQHPNYYSKVAETTQPNGGMLPDVTYKLGTLTGATIFSFAATVSGNMNHYYFTFTSGSTAVVPTWPASITSWDGNCVDSTTGLPVIAASKTYEVSVLDGNAIIKEW
jgi:hypothetical protein